MTSSVDLGLPHLRVARPTDDLAAVVRFYHDGLGLDVLYHFKDHDGFDGVMLGRKGAGYHLEFTHKAGHQAGTAPTEDNLLVIWVDACHERDGTWPHSDSGPIPESPRDTARTGPTSTGVSVISPPSSTSCRCSPLSPPAGPARP